MLEQKLEDKHNNKTEEKEDKKLNIPWQRSKKMVEYKLLQN